MLHCRCTVGFYFRIPVEFFRLKETDIAATARTSLLCRCLLFFFLTIFIGHLKSILIPMANTIDDIITISVDPSFQLWIGTIRCQHIIVHRVISYRVQMIDIVLDFVIFGTVLLINIGIRVDTPIEDQTAEACRKNQPVSGRLSRFEIRRWFVGGGWRLDWGLTGLRASIIIDQEEISSIGINLDVFVSHRTVVVRRFARCCIALNRWWTRLVRGKLCRLCLLGLV